MNIPCGSCGADIPVADGMAGKEVACPACQAIVTIPAESGQVACPYCAEPIQAEAIKCRHCGEMVKGEPRKKGPSPAMIQAIQKSGSTALILGILGIAFCAIVAPFAIISGNRVNRRLRELGADSSGTATTGIVLGWIGSVMFCFSGVAIIAAIAIPGVLSATRAANERNAAGTLKMFSSTQVMIKTMDPDQNGVNDYWVDDVAGIHYELDQIERVVAGADANTAKAYPGHSSLPKGGYWFRALPSFEDGSSVSSYKEHRVDRFGIGAFPHEYGSSGKLVMFLNEAGTMYKSDPWSGAYWDVKPTIGLPDTSSRLGPGYDSFPLGPEATKKWRRVD